VLPRAVAKLQWGEGGLSQLAGQTNYVTLTTQYSVVDLSDYTRLLHVLHEACGPQPGLT